MTVKAPPLTERDFQRQVTDLAEIRGWSWLHVRAGRTADSWRVPVSGPLGKGWPDLLLLRPSQGQVMAVELKREGAHATPEQLECLIALREVSIPAMVWHPSDWPEIEKALA